MSRTQVQLTIADEYLNHVDELAKKESRSRSNMISVLIQEAIAARINNEETKSQDI